MEGWKGRRKREREGEKNRERKELKDGEIERRKRVGMREGVRERINVPFGYLISNNSQVYY